MRAFLMRLEGCFVAEQFVEQELLRLVRSARDQEQVDASFPLRLGQELIEDGRDLVGLALLAFPLRDHQQAAAGDGVSHGLLTGCVGCRHAWYSQILLRPGLGRCDCRKIHRGQRHAECADGGASADGCACSLRDIDRFHGSPPVVMTGQAKLCPISASFNSIAIEVPALHQCFDRDRSIGGRVMLR